MNSMIDNIPARTLLQFDVTGWAPERVAAVVAAAGAGSPAHPTPDTALGDGESGESSGWTTDSLVAAIAALRNTKAYAQVQVIEAAARNGGYVSRADTYVVAGYDPAQRSLKGFTRPVNRVVSKLQDDGQVGVEVEDLLQPVYDATVKGYQRASGFRIPSDVAALIAHNH